MRTSSVSSWFLIVSTLELAGCGPPSSRAEETSTADTELVPVPPLGGMITEGAFALPVSADAAVAAGEMRDVAHGDETTAQVKTYPDTPAEGWAFRRAYLRFDLTPLEGEVPRAARVALFGNVKDGTQPVVVELFEADDATPWEESSVTWETQPARRDDVLDARIAFRAVLDDPARFDELGAWEASDDVSSLLRSAMERSSTLTVRLENPTVNEALFFCREHEADVDVMPRLVVWGG